MGARTGHVSASRPPRAVSSILSPTSATALHARHSLTPSLPFLSSPLSLSRSSRKPASRHGSGHGVSMRYIPKHIIHWLDTCWPLEGHDEVRKLG